MTFIDYLINNSFFTFCLGALIATSAIGFYSFVINNHKEGPIKAEDILDQEGINKGFEGMTRSLEKFIALVRYAKLELRFKELQDQANRLTFVEQEERSAETRSLKEQLTTAHCTIGELKETIDKYKTTYAPIQKLKVRKQRKR